MKRLLIFSVAIVFGAIGIMMAPADAEARNRTCTIKATKDVNLQAHFSEGGNKSPSIRRKSDVIWSGNLRRGAAISLSTHSGWVHLAYQDLTQEDPRSENDDRICMNNRVILVPR